MNQQDEPIRVLIADDHPSILDGLQTMLGELPDMRVVGAAANGTEAVEAALKLAPDVILMDLQMPRMDGVAAITALHRDRCRSAIIVLTTFSGDARVSRALKAGATSYLLKTASIAEIIQAVRKAASGMSVLTPAVASEMLAHAATDQLNEREVSVLRLVSQGNRNRRIGQYLNVSEQTIKTRIKNILAKLCARDRAHAVTIARLRGFIDG
jgi:DNA-binding NarL/FixJ family response regulator